MLKFNAYGHPTPPPKETLPSKILLRLKIQVFAPPPPKEKKIIVFINKI